MNSNYIEVVFAGMAVFLAAIAIGLIMCGISWIVDMFFDE